MNRIFQKRITISSMLGVQEILMQLTTILKTPQNKNALFEGKVSLDLIRIYPLFEFTFNSMFRPEIVITINPIVGSGSDVHVLFRINEFNKIGLVVSFILLVIVSIILSMLGINEHIPEDINPMIVVTIIIGFYILFILNLAHTFNRQVEISLKHLRSILT